MPNRAIKAIFFTRFHHEKGSRVLHQVPEGSITPSSSSSALSQPLFAFDAVAPYIIPNQQFCDRLLTFCTNHYRVIGYPVCIREGKYSRNEFIFNFALVIAEGVVDWGCWGEVVRKLGRLLRGLEEQAGFLSREESDVWEDDSDDGNGGGEGPWDAGVGNGSKVYALCEMILEDLNNYSECMIPIDDSNTINLKLFPLHQPPPPIFPHHVPVLTISLSSLSSPISSDLTLTHALPYIDGVNSVQQISQLADADVSLTRKAIQHLVYYGCVILLDVFQFNAVYAPTAEFGAFVIDKSIGLECARYVLIPGRTSRPSFPQSSQSDRSRSRDSTSSAQSDISVEKIEAPYPNHSLSSQDQNEETIDHETLIQLYTSLRQGLTLKNWVLENLSLLRSIDVRRFITFGMIKGFLYRVHKYAITTSAPNPNLFFPHRMPPAPPPSLRVQDNGSERTVQGLSDGVNGFGELDGRSDGRDALPLLRFLDGMHCFDEICTELGKSEREVEGKLKEVGEVEVIWK